MLCVLHNQEIDSTSRHKMTNFRGIKKRYYQYKRWEVKSVSSLALVRTNVTSTASKTIIKQVILANFLVDFSMFVKLEGFWFLQLRIVFIKWKLIFKFIKQETEMPNVPGLKGNYNMFTMYTMQKKMNSQNKSLTWNFS